MSAYKVISPAGLKQESPANAKVSARQQCVYMKTHSEEIYGKSTQGTQCKSLHFALYTATVGLMAF